MRIPKGGAYLPAIRPRYLEERIDTLGSCKEREMLLAAYHRRRGMAITDISVEMSRPRTTIRGWLARAMERGPDDLSDRKVPGRRTLLDEPSRWWLSELLGRGPGGCGFQAGSWQSGTILELIRREFGILCSPRTLRRMLHKIRFSYRKPRLVPYNSAPEAEQGEFKRRTSAEVGRLTGHGYAVFSEDEALRRLSAAAGYGWFPTNGNETVPTGFSTRCVRMFGILGKDGHHVQTAEATNSRTFVDFLKWVLPEISKIRARLGQRLVPQVGNGHGLSGVRQRGHPSGIPAPVHAAAQPNRDTLEGDQAAVVLPVL